MQTKLQTLKDTAARQDWQSALRIAAKFADLGEHKAAIVRGHEAHTNARFAVQLGRDPAADIEAGVSALCARYALNRDGTESTAPKAYSAKNNCIRAARKALGAEAQPGVDFALVQGEAGWTWGLIVAEAPAAEPVLAELGTPEAGELLTVAAEALVQAEASLERAEASTDAALDRPARARTSSPELIAKRRAMLAAADAKGFSTRWAAAHEAAKAGELPEAPDFRKPTHVSGRKWLAEAVALVATGDLEGLRGLVYDPEGSTGSALHRYVRFSALALEAREGWATDRLSNNSRGSQSRLGHAVASYGPTI